MRNAPRAIWWRGTYWPVSDGFWADTIVPYPELEDMDWPQVHEEMGRLLTISDYRRLTGAETARLRAYNRHWNLRSNINFLDGRSCGEFGCAFYDQCHGWRGQFDCGCDLHGVFDDFLAARVEPGEPIAIHPHTPRHVCEGHRHLAGDWAALHAEVIG